MASAQQVANSFVTEFVERLARSPSELADLYGHRATVTICDFEMGITESYDADVPIAVQQWAEIVQGSRLTVDSVNAAPLYSGVNVFISMTAVGELQQYFQITTSLESYSSGFATEGYYIRHQVIARVGALPVPPPQPAEPEPQPVEEQPAAPEAAPQPQAQADQQEAPKKSPTPEPAAEEEAKPAKKEAAGKPKSWASLASAAKGIDQSKAVRITAGLKKEEPAAAAKPSAPAAGAGAKEPIRRERKQPEPVGDRLMFSTSAAVTDEEVKAALGPVAAHLVSLRNNSAREHGCVFMDFAVNVKAFEEIRKLNPVIGAAKTPINVFRQRPRE